jgi:molybdopterin-guanine dinucleotide biosynthesis protein A
MTATPTGTAAVIAGGPGTRLGGAVKSALVVGGRSVAERQLAVLRGLFARIVVVANDAGPWAAAGAEIVPDRHADAGPLGGLHAALAATQAEGAVVCVGGDMPFLEPPLLRLLRDGRPEAQALVARVGGRPEPLLARYAARCLPVVEAQLQAGERAVHRVLPLLGVAWLDEPELRAVDPELRSLTNINTPDDLARAEALARSPR